MISKIKPALKRRKIVI